MVRPDPGAAPDLSTRPVRSWLYVPAFDDRKLDRAARAGADVVLLDLEDGTPPAEKERARAGAASRLAGPGFGSSLRAVRIQAPGEATTWREDVRATVGGGPDAYMLPKVEDPVTVDEVQAEIEAADLGWSPALMVLIESAVAVLGAPALARHPAVSGLAWGAEDLSTDLGARPVRRADGSFAPVFAQARHQVALGATAAGIICLDTPNVDHRNDAAMAAQTRSAAELGLTGVQAIHPNQVSVIHDGLRPPASEIERARRIVELLGAAGGGAASLDGEMVDTPHLRAARRTLARVGA